MIQSGFPPHCELEVFLCWPWDGPASKKESSELWREAREKEHVHEYYDLDYCIEDWVDGTEVFTDALERAREDLKPQLNPELELNHMRLEGASWDYPAAWKILFIDYYSGYEYLYDAVDGRYIGRDLYSVVHPPK